MDFPERLKDYINNMPLPDDIHLKLGYLGSGESLVMYPLSGGRIIDEFMDGTTDQQLNYEIAMKSKKQSEISDTLWEIQSRLELVQNIESNDGSFDFHKLEITNKPFINQIDEQGWFVFLLDIQAELTIYNKGE